MEGSRQSVRNRLNGARNGHMYPDSRIPHIHETAETAIEMPTILWPYSEPTNRK